MLSGATEQAVEPDLGETVELPKASAAAATTRPGLEVLVLWRELRLRVLVS